MEIKRIEAVYDHIIQISEQLVNSRTNKQEKYYNYTIGPLVEQFIKDNNFIIKNNMILHKMDPIIDLSEAKYYYEIYAGSNGKDLLKIFCDKLYNMNSSDFTYLEIVRSSEYTYDLKNNFKIILRLINLHTHIFKKIPFNIYNKLHYIDPNLMRLDVYNIYCNPTLDVGQWRAAYQTEQALNAIFPIKPSTCNNKTTKKDIISKLTSQWIPNNDNIILTGDAVLNYLLMFIKSNILIPIQYITVLSQKPDKEITKIKKIFNNDVKIKKERPTGLRYFKQKYMVYHQNQLIAVIYNVSDKCYPYTQLKDSRLKIATVHLLIKFYLIEYLYNKIDRNCILYKIHLIQTKRDTYLKQHNMTGIETSPLQVFHHICWGTQYNIQRELLIAATKRKYHIYRYKPGIK